MLLELLGVTVYHHPRCPLSPSGLAGGGESSLSPHPHPIRLVNNYSPLTTKGQSMVLNSPPFRQTLHPLENRVFARHNLIFLNLSMDISWVLPTRLTMHVNYYKACPCGSWPPGVDMEAEAKDEISALTWKKLPLGPGLSSCPGLHGFLPPHFPWSLSFLLNTTEMCSQLNRPCQKTQDLLEQALLTRYGTTWK